MPCMKCANGKYKYGEHGNCQFDTLKACKAAAAAIHAKPKPKKELETKDMASNTKLLGNTYTHIIFDELSS